MEARVPNSSARDLRPTAFYVGKWRWENGRSRRDSLGERVSVDGGMRSLFPPLTNDRPDCSAPPPLECGLPVGSPIQLEVDNGVRAKSVAASWRCLRRCFEISSILQDARIFARLHGVAFRPSSSTYKVGLLQKGILVEDRLRIVSVLFVRKRPAGKDAAL
ncbi:hypothetical protein MRX96_041014 [Rhipicephalus microplus]